MKLIATHENTDFDAFAALVAAARLYPDFLAVIPYRVNRNVHEFLQLYQEQLPLTWPDDLPDEPVEAILLVDTQTPPQPRALDQDTAVMVIDHHSMDEPIANARYDLARTGSTTTILVERLIEASLPVNPLEATLYLLGIYEDTGNLSYGTTSSRDLQAAAWLLESGGSLKMANRFLRYPLNEEQRQLYGLLAQNMETVEVESAKIAITTASAGQYVEEISNLAHRLRDLYEPDALFMLVQMPDHIQMVARASNGTVDVGKAASYFGGGGHQRASAALVRGSSLEEVKQELLRLLPSLVAPAVTVRQIMSYGVHVLAPDTKVSEAAMLMQRYGHEGFPVVDGDRVVGVITRREIDRAMHHKLNRAPVRVYVRAEGVSVAPETGVRELQRLMSEHNIGQMPVVEKGRVIGIVTRTDLIKLWADEHNLAEKPESLAQSLKEALPEPLYALVQAAAQQAALSGYKLYGVGGFVRDLVLGIPNLDLDLVVEGDAITLAQALARQHGGEVRSHRRFGTAKWLVTDIWQEQGLTEQLGLPEHIDFATARTEFYERPSALPVVERSSIKQDLHRRDFTINTLAVSLQPEHFGDVLDFFGGVKDLQRRLVRVLHSLSFVEDPTRILRAVRLAARLDFRIEPRTASLLQDAVELLERTTGERLAHELNLILAETEPERALAQLQDLGVLSRISPALHHDQDIAELMAAARQLSPRWQLTAEDWPVLCYLLLAWGADAEAAAELSEHLHLNKPVRATLVAMPLLQARLPELSEPSLPPSRISRLLRPFNSAVLLVAYLKADSELLRKRLLRFLEEWQYVQPEIGGDQLRQLGLKPGPVFRQILELLRDLRLDGKLATEADELASVRSLLADQEQWQQLGRQEV